MRETGAAVGPVVPVPGAAGLVARWRRTVRPGRWRRQTMAAAVAPGPIRRAQRPDTGSVGPAATQPFPVVPGGTVGRWRWGRCPLRLGRGGGQQPQHQNPRGEQGRQLFCKSMRHGGLLPTKIVARVHLGVGNDNKCRPDAPPASGARGWPPSNRKGLFRNFFSLPTARFSCELPNGTPP